MIHFLIFLFISSSFSYQSQALYSFLDQDDIVLYNGVITVYDESSWRTSISPFSYMLHGELPDFPIDTLDAPFKLTVQLIKEQDKGMFQGLQSLYLSLPDKETSHLFIGKLDYHTYDNTLLAALQPIDEIKTIHPPIEHIIITMK